MWNRALWTAELRKYARAQYMLPQEYKRFVLMRQVLEEALSGWKPRETHRYTPAVYKKQQKVPQQPTAAALEAGGSNQTGDGTVAMKPTETDSTQESEMEKEVEFSLDPQREPAVLMYGSAVSGTAFKHGDVDFAVAFPDCPTIPRPVQPQYLTSCYDYLVSSGPSSSSLPSSSGNNELSEVHQGDNTSTLPDTFVLDLKKLGTQRIFRARVPILHTPPAAGHHEKFDISLSLDGVRNTMLIREYVTKYPVLKGMALALKGWGRRRAVLNARRGWLSPYALTVMLIHYMAHTKQLELLDIGVGNDSVQHQMEALWNRNGDGIPYPSLVEDRDIPDDIADRLQGFFKYYTDDFDFDEDIIDIGVLQPNIGKDAAQQRVVEDPPLAGSKDRFFTAEERETLTDAEKWHRLGYGMINIRDPYEKHSLGRNMEFFRSEQLREHFRDLAEDSSVTPTSFGLVVEE